MRTEGSVQRRVVCRTQVRSTEHLADSTHTHTTITNTTTKPPPLPEDPASTEFFGKKQLRSRVSVRKFAHDYPINDESVTSRDHRRIPSTVPKTTNYVTHERRADFWLKTG